MSKPSTYLWDTSKNPDSLDTFPKGVPAVGRAFDAAAFDAEKTNLWLQKLKWPRVTEAQLRKVLLGRDDYHE